MPRHGVGLNELLGGGGCQRRMNPADAPERRSDEVCARPENFSGRVRSNRIRSLRTHRQPITVSEAGERNACEA